jgi:hypothetical protein
VKDEDGLHHVGDPVGAAVELPQKTPALERGHSSFAGASDLGVTGVVAALPPLQTATAERDSNRPAGALIRLVRPALQARLGERVDDSVVSGSSEVVGRSGQGGRGPEQASERIGE